MKKGCFLTAIIFLTILIGSGVYLYKKYSYKLEDYGKDKIMKITLEKINKKIDELEKNKYNDSLKLFIKNKAEELKRKEFIYSMNRFQTIIDYTKILIEDNKIDSAEFYNIKKLAVENEKPEKDRN